MKAQLTIEYLISFGLFIGVVIYVYIMYTKNIPLFLEEVRKEDIRAKAYQISELILNDVGEPQNWEDLGNPQIERIGLSDPLQNKPNFISLNKINRFGSECNNDFSNIQRWLDLDYRFSIFIFEIDQTTGDRTPLATCTPPTIGKRELNSTVKRIAMYEEGNEKKIAEIIVQV